MKSQHIAAVAAIALGCPSLSLADPLTLDVMLGLERYGRIAIDPSGSVGVFEEKFALSDMPRHDVEAYGADRYAHLYRVEMTAPYRVSPLLAEETGAGYTAGAFSPDGTRLAVFRLKDDLWRLGIVEMATGAVSWTEVAPELGLWGRALEWVSDDVLLVLGTTDGAMPSRLTGPRADQARLLALRAAATMGAPAAVSTGTDRPAPAPDGRRLWRVEAASGHAAAVADGPILDFESSPDGRHVALLLEGPLLPPASQDTASEVRRALSLQIAPVAGGSAVSPPGARAISPILLSWSPDSRALLVAAVGSERGRLLAISPSGETRDVTPLGIAAALPVDFMGMESAQAGWIGDAIVMRGRMGSTEAWYRINNGDAVAIQGLQPDARLVAQGGSAVLFNDNGEILRLRATDGPTRLGAASLAASAYGPFGNRGQAGPMKADAAFVTDDHGRLCRVPAEVRPAQCVVATRGAAVSWSRGLSLQRGADDETGRLMLVQGAHRTPVWRLNPELDGVTVSEPRLIKGPGDVRGWLYLPAGHTGPPPVVVVPYQGETYATPPHWMRRDATDLSLAPQLLVAQGYAVLFPDLPPTPEPADGLAHRILAVVDVAADQGLVDPDRVGLWGWSFGAWSSAMSAAQSPRFRAVVGLNGPMNFPSIIGELGTAARLEGGNNLSAASVARWLESGQAAMRSAYWSAPDRYRRNSPFEQADRITTPVLLVIGEYDGMVAQSEQLYGALHRLNRPVALTLLFGEAHGIQSPGNIRLYYDQVVTWFDRYLKGDGPPAAPSSDGPRPR